MKQTANATYSLNEIKHPKLNNKMSLFFMPHDIQPHACPWGIKECRHVANSSHFHQYKNVFICFGVRNGSGMSIQVYIQFKSIAKTSLAN